MIQRFLFLLLISHAVIAYEPGDTANDGNEDIPPFRQSSVVDVVRAIAGGNNFFAHLERVSSHLYFVNPSLDPVSIHVVHYYADGSRELKFLKLEPRGSKLIEFVKLEGAVDVSVLSLQRYELYIQPKNRTLAETHYGMTPVDVAVPRRPSLSFAWVTADSGASILVGIDAANQVHHVIHGKIIGKWDAKEEAVIRPDGRTYPRVQ